MKFNKEELEQTLEGLDEIQQVETLRNLSETVDELTKIKEPEAVSLIRSLYPDYAPGGELEGKQFEHKGHSYQVQVKRDYNYANVSREYAELMAKNEALMEEKKANSKLLAALRKKIRLEHPRLRPISEQIVLKVVE